MIERTPEDKARFSADMKRIAGERTQEAPPLNWVCACGYESRGIRNTHCPECGKERPSSKQRTQHTSDFNYRENAETCDEARKAAGELSRIFGWKEIDAYNAVLQGVAVAESRPINKAAPELLEACKAADRAMDAQMFPKTAPTRKQLIAAIAKAEGRAQ